MLLTTSCCSWCPVNEIRIPVPVACPVPPVYEAIVDPVLSFTPTTGSNQMIKDLRAARVLWRDRAIQQEILLDTYRPKIQ